MKIKYHVNQSTGEYGKCTAEKRGCPLGDAVVHLEKLSDVVEYSDLIMKENYGSFNSLKKKYKKIDNNKLEINSNYPYPEAHKLEKVDKVIFSLQSGYVPRAAISSLLGTKDRVSDFYAEAGCYLGLAEAVLDDKGNKTFSLTENGVNYIKQKKKDREKILKDTISNIDLVKDINNNSDKENILNKISQTHGESSETADRKLSSMRSWSRQINEDTFLSEIDYEEVEQKIAKGWELYERKTAEQSVSSKETYGDICQTCFMAKSLTGICDNCDD